MPDSEKCTKEPFAVSLENFLYDNHYDVRSQKKSQTTCAVSYMYSADKINFTGLKERISSFKECKIWDITTELIQAVYIENNDENFLVFNPHSNKEMIDEFHLNQSADASLSDGITKFALKHDINRISSLDYEAFDSLIDTYTAALAKLFDCKYEDVEKIKALNSQKLLIHSHKELKAERIFEPKGHLDFFSYIYFCELYVIGELFKNSSSVLLHDVATNTAQLPLLINSLTESECFDIKFDKVECSDIDVGTAAKFIANCVENRLVNGDNIELKYVNLMEDISTINKADVIIANDVLEHFQEDLSLSVFKKLWSSTKDVLIVHVPTEEIPNESYGHLTSFNSSKLTSWADELDNCENLSDNFPQLSRFGGITEAGFLFLRKRV